MRVVSVIDRELRTSARQSFTYSLRVLGVVSLLIVLGLFSLNGDLGPEIGGKLFGWLHATLFFAIWVFAPLLTSDCISRERREGTLPLLFLTNLNPREIVFAKGFAHSFRAGTLWLAVLPLLAVPLVAGGVGWPEVLISALVNVSALCLATAAGLVASASSKVWSRALALALCIAFIFFVAYLFALPGMLLAAGPPARRGPFFWMRNEWGPAFGLWLATNFEGIWQQWLAGGGYTIWRALAVVGSLAVFSIALLLLMIRFASWRVKRVWREEPPSARVQWLQKKLFTPLIFQTWLRRWLDWQLARNPIGWLGQRSWVGRIVVWGWFAVVVCIYSSLFSNMSLYQRGFHEVQVVVAWMLAGSIALSAAGSFRRERDTGMMELLLVSPIREWQIIGGRIRGLWTQFLPAVILLMAVWLYTATFIPGINEWPAELTTVLVFAIAFATLPVIGLYFSLSRNNYIISVVLTFLCGIVLPTAVAEMVSYWMGPVSNSSYTSSEFLLPQLFLPSLVRLVLAGLFAWILHRRLRFRRFDFDKRA